MTEREKMLAGELYDCGDEQLLKRWHYAKKLQLQYNSADTTDVITLNRDSRLILSI